MAVKCYLTTNSSKVQAWTGIINNTNQGVFILEIATYDGPVRWSFTSKVAEELHEMLEMFLSDERRRLSGQ